MVFKNIVRTVVLTIPAVCNLSAIAAECRSPRERCGHSACIAAAITQKTATFYYLNADLSQADSIEDLAAGNIVPADVNQADLRQALQETVAAHYFTVNLEQADSIEALAARSIVQTDVNQADLRQALQETVASHYFTANLEQVDFREALAACGIVSLRIQKANLRKLQKLNSLENCTDSI